MPMDCFMPVSTNGLLEELSVIYLYPEVKNNISYIVGPQLMVDDLIDKCFLNAYCEEESPTLTTD